MNPQSKFCAKVRNISFCFAKLKNFPKYGLPSYINFDKCREEIAFALNDFGNRLCKREGVEDNALKEWKRSIFTIVDKRIKFYSQNTNLLPPKPKSSFRHLKQGIQEFHRKYVLVPAGKAANNVFVVCRLLYVNTLKQELDGTELIWRQILMECL